MDSGSRRGRPKGRRDLWPERDIIQVKKTVKEDLDSVADPAQPGVRLRHALKRINEYGGELSAKNKLYCYVYIVSALVHHQRWGGLKPHQITRLRDYAFDILRIEGIDLASPRLAFLYGDLHLVLSQIHRKSGSQWEAAWEQQTATRLFKNNEARGEAFQALGLAIRAFRLGNLPLALDRYARVEEIEGPEGDFMQARLGRIKVIRLSGDHEAASKLIEETLALGNLGVDERTELEWEALSLEAQKTGQLHGMISKCRRGQVLYQGVYILEALLWARASPQESWVGRMSTLSTYKRNADLRIVRLGALYEAAATLEECYDTDIPFHHRLCKLGRCLAKLNHLITIDQELLVLGAATRWLARNSAFGHASLVLGEYEATSLRLSSGKTHDVLNTLENMLDRPWYQSISQEAG